MGASFPGPWSWRQSDGLGHLGLIRVSHQQQEGGLPMLRLVYELEEPGWSKHSFKWKSTGC